MGAGQLDTFEIQLASHLGIRFEGFKFISILILLLETSILPIVMRLGHCRRAGCLFDSKIMFGMSCIDSRG